MPTLALCNGGHLWLWFVCPFVLKQKDQKFKADIMGPTRMASAPPPCRPGPRSLPSLVLAFPHTVSTVSTSLLNDTHRPLTVIAGPDPRSPTPSEDYPLVVALRHREERSDPDEE